MYAQTTQLCITCTYPIAGVTKANVNLILPNLPYPSF